VMAEPIVAPIPEITLATTTNPIASDTPEMITAIAIVQTTPQIKPIIIIPTQVSGIIKARVGEKLIIKKADLATSQKDTIQAVTNKPIQLTVEMNQPINRLKGSIIFKTKKIEPVAREFSLKTFLASLFSTKLAWADLVNTDNAIIVSEFNYINNGDGAYSANIETPDVAGTYDLITKVNFVDPNIPAEDIKVTASVDQAGSVYSKINNEEFHVSMAKVSLFKLNEINNKYELWGGIKDFQVNPQVTAGDGTYAFFPPTGTYYLQVEAPYYSDYQSKTFQVNTGEVVSQKIELKRGFWQHIQALLYKR
ncbi:MAG: carboxypeptidase-like regulatory domain-containing protein, partial [Candidatus Falkowbacteria bacterium]|nr:carboxypeptidase-like regulatory domain-containing protein [Candidatus Falkowbacteria bacterium]